MDGCLATGGKRPALLLGALLSPFLILWCHEEWACHPQVIILLGVPSWGFREVVKRVQSVPFQEGVRCFLSCQPLPSFHQISVSGSPAFFPGLSMASTVWLEEEVLEGDRCESLVGGEMQGETEVLGPFFKIGLINSIWCCPWFGASWEQGL